MKHGHWGMLLVSVVISVGASAQHSSPAGLWRNIDDETGKPRALIRIVERDGEFSGRIERLFPEPGENANPVCDRCEGALRNKPVIGMEIMGGLHAAGNDFDGGYIVDPKNGKKYNCKLTLAEGGRAMNVRGYIGMPWIGRTQRWIRQD